MNDYVTNHPKKSLGQHWLRDLDALESICAAADVSGADTVLEIGPGLGTLTEQLAERARKVVAIEVDHTLAVQLQSRFRGSNVQVEEADILQFDYASIPGDYKVVANIPYYLTSNLIRSLSETDHPPLCAALLVQKEVAERLAARPGSMSVLSVSAQYYWHVALGILVPAELFTPPPKVDSQVVILKQRATPLFAGSSDTEYFRLVKAGFGQRRKTLANALSGGLRIPRGQAEKLLRQSGIDPRSRAQTLSLEDWHRLAETYVA